MINAEIVCAMHTLVAEYWRRVDRLSGDPVDALYVEDGLMHLGALRCEGRAAIREFFKVRNEQEMEVLRTTRHLTSNLFVELLGPVRYRLLSTVQVLSGNGEWPLLSQAASSVGDFDDVVVRAPDGEWKFESRTARIVFAGAGAASFAR